MRIRYPWGTTFIQMARQYNRHPPGSKKGGQFAPKNAGGAGGSEPPEVREAKAIIKSAAAKRDSQLAGITEDREITDLKAIRNQLAEKQKKYDTEGSEWGQSRELAIDIQAFNELNRISKRVTMQDAAKNVWLEYSYRTADAHDTLMDYHTKQAAEVRAELAKPVSYPKRHGEIQKELDDLSVQTKATLTKIMKELESPGTYTEKEYKQIETDEKQIRDRQYKLKIEQLSVTRKAQRDKDSILNVDNPTRVGLVDVHGTLDDRKKAFWQSNTDQFNRLIDASVMPPRDVGFIEESGRASANAFNNAIYLDPYSVENTIPHELGHIAEGKNPRMQREANNFLNTRTQGETPKRLSEITGKIHFDDSETAKADEFTNPYSGKTYVSGQTEIISMGLEYMATDPQAFAESDPDYFDFIYAVSRSG